MRLPTIQGVIRRRILANFRVDPEVMQRQLPSRFTPKLHGDFAVAGICLIRLEHIRPKFVPESVGLTSENAAHRVAVRWHQDGQEREGVFISRRDTTVDIEGKITERLPSTSIFSSLEEASSFFETGSLGYSVTRDAKRLDGLQLSTKQWRVEPLEIARVFSSYFSDENAFPKSSIEFDHALIMRDVDHEWHSAEDLYI